MLLGCAFCVCLCEQEILFAKQFAKPLVAKTGKTAWYLKLLNIPLAPHSPPLQPPTPTTLLIPAENNLGHYSVLSKPVTAPRWSRQD